MGHQLLVIVLIVLIVFILCRSQIEARLESYVDPVQACLLRSQGMAAACGHARGQHAAICQQKAKAMYDFCLNKRDIGP